MERARAAEEQLPEDAERGKRARQDWDWVAPALKFKVIARQGNARASVLELPHYTCSTPMFMPVGTQGTVKGLTPDELERLDCHLILGNTYHLGNRPGAVVVAEMGGLHKFIHWPRAMLTDSGGFQMVSLLKLAEITEQGVKFQSPHDGTEMLLTPELSMEVQNKLGADIMMALDDVVPATCTDPARVEEAMHRTLRWIVRCENAHKRKNEQNLFPIVQGGLNPQLRSQCLDGLIKLNAPGYAIGGLSGGESKDQFWRVVLQCASALPPHKPRYLMGVGYAVDLVVCTALGVDMFDCLAADTPVTLASGVTMKIKDLTHLPEVFSLGPNNTFVPTRATAHLQRGYRECIELVFSDGRTLVCTPDHRIRTTTGWCEARALAKGQNVVLGIDGPLYDPTDDNQIDRNAFKLELEGVATLDMTNLAAVARAHAFARILGFLYTDGTVAKNEEKNAFMGRIYLGHRIDADQVVKDLALVLGKRCEVQKPANCNYYMISLPSYFIRALCSHPAILVPIGSRKYQAYALPALVSNSACPKSFVREFLGGLFGGDGGAPNPQGALTWNTVTFSQCKKAKKLDALKAFMESIKILLQRLEINCELDGPYEITGHPNSKPKKGEGRQTMQYLLRVSNLQIVAFLKHVGFRYCAHKQQRLAVAAACYRRRDYSCEQLQTTITRVLQPLVLQPAAAVAFGKLVRSEEGEGSEEEEEEEEDSEDEEAQQTARHKVRYGVDRRFDGFPTWTASFVGARPVGVREVYDISVPGSENFLANGVMVHNCVYPTRTARFGTALVPWGTMQLKAKEFAADFAPIDDSCTCVVCKSYTRAYLHVVAAKEPIGCQLLTHHNIAYQMRLMREMRTSITEQRFPAYVQAFFLRQFPKKNYPSWAVDALQAVHIALL